ncbi:hypothetical protein GQ473_06755 [archaeon]|nr:hypothetical protein [archaeon]
MWTELFLSLGFFGFYTIWAILVGGIAVFGFISKFTRKKIIRDVFVSWFIGVLIITSSPIGGLIFAVFLRMFLIGFKSIISIETLKSTFIKPDAKPIAFPKHKIIKFTIILIILFGFLAAIFAPPMEVDWYNMRNTNTVTPEITTTSDVSQIKWDDIKDMRIVAQQYALQVPKTMVTETGWKLSNDWDGIYSINNTLYWVMVYEPTRFANIGEPSPAYIIVNAQNPSDRVKINEKIEYSEERKGLVPFLYQIITGKIRDVNFNLWYAHPYFTYGDTVFTHDDKGEPVWFAPAKLNLPTIFVTKLYTTQVGVIVLENNGVTTFYTESQIKAEETPEWFLKNQVLIDEDYTAMRIDRWAKYANWKGFLNFHFKHENVFEIARDIYFQYDKPEDRTYGLMQLEPEGPTRKAITQYVEIEAYGKNYGHVTIYDTRALGLIGPERALADVRGEISLYSDWYALQPLFKQIKNGFYYVVPVYSGVYESMTLKSVAIVDARTEQVKLFPWGTQEVIDVDEVVDDGTVSPITTPTNCEIIETATVDGKLRFTIECE